MIHETDCDSVTAALTNRNPPGAPRIYSIA